eukprot:1455988-Amphidinium_carterae.1
MARATLQISATQLATILDRSAFTTVKLIHDDTHDDVIEAAFGPLMHEIAAVTPRLTSVFLKKSVGHCEGGNALERAKVESLIWTLWQKLVTKGKHMKSGARSSEVQKKFNELLARSKAGGPYAWGVGYARFPDKRGNAKVLSPFEVAQLPFQLW